MTLTSSDTAVPKYPRRSSLPPATASLNLGVLPDGVHPITITVTDKDGAASSAHFTVTVGDTGRPAPSTPTPTSSRSPRHAAASA